MFVCVFTPECTFRWGMIPFLETRNLVHILSADHTDVFQSVHHAVNGRDADAVIPFYCFVVNLFAGGAVFVQNDV